MARVSDLIWNDVLMRVLLIAYEFPPSPSPQALRWVYLSRELAALGHEIHVIVPERGGTTVGLPPLPEQLHLHQTFPGPARYLLSILRKRGERKRQRSPASADAGHTSAIPSPKHWKQRLVKCVLHLAEYLHYPDIRGEWRMWARRPLRRLLREIKPDVVISSHEPATTLELGLMAKRYGFCWVADLGDPVLAGYTPAHWKTRAKRLERQVLQQADLITLTNPAAATLMQQRHPYCRPMQIVPQGFEHHPFHIDDPLIPTFDAHQLELLYTGSFYAFRTPDALIQAVQAQPGVRLTIASNTVPVCIIKAARQSPERIRVLGFMPHTVTLELQRRADILVNIANQERSQIPGKFNEYLGAQRPILHLATGPDAMSADISALRRGWHCDNQRDAIHSLLGRLCMLKSEGILEEHLELGLDSVMERSWQQIARTLSRTLDRLHQPTHIPE